MGLLRKRSRWERLVKPVHIPKSRSARRKPTKSSVADLSKPLRSGLGDLPAAVKPGLVAAGGLVGLTGVSAGVSSIRRRSERARSEV